MGLEGLGLEGLGREGLGREGLECEGLEAAMSSDFSIKPVGAPAATPFVQPSSAAANHPVPTELPASQSVTATSASAGARNDPQPADDSVSRQAFIDQAAASIVYQVVDNRTSLVLRQFPDQGLLRRRAYARALEQAREDAIALKVDRTI